MIWIVHFSFVHMLAIFTKFIAKPKFFVNGIFLYSIFVFGQRWMTGEDYPGYLLYYLTQFDSGLSTFFWVQNYLSSIGLYFGFFVFLIYTLTLFNVFFVIKRINKNIFIMVFLFVFFEMYLIQMSQIRQQLAISFYLLAYLNSFRNNFFLAALFSLIAVSIHMSTIFVIPFLFIRVKYSKALVYCSILLCCLFPLVDVKIILQVVNLGYGSYVGGVYDVQLNQLHMIRYFAVVFFGVFILLASKVDRSDPVQRMIIIGFFLYLFLYGLSFQFAPFLRVVYFFKFFEIVIFGYFLTDIVGPKRVVFWVGIYVLTMGIFLSAAILDPYNITGYQFRLLQLEETRSDSELKSEISNFYYAD